MHLLLLLAFIASFLNINDGEEWCYHSQFECTTQCKTPDRWQTIRNNEKCSGNEQSPINIVTKKTRLDEGLTPFQLSGFQETFHSTITNNGHSVKVPVATNAYVSGGKLDGRYKAVQFHLHWGKDGGPGSEHTVDGEQYPMELHIVTMKEKYTSLSNALADRTGVAVLGFFYEESSRSNKQYDAFINAVSRISQSGANTSITLSLNTIMPSPQNMTNYFRYPGSLTTPGCAEAVVWTVFERPIPLSRSQLQAFSRLLFKDNKAMVNTFRPVQPLNNRIVFRSAGDAVLGSIILLTVSLAAAVRLSSPN
ncbi:hypothetical protein AGOR_G00020940 [Albula goreensis]|uniref:Carbonic anhydrase n=1 Tax=Albula goreensis TaxID=1534307 RepID=A0A8T3E5E7_9TELE|nr:hypothetical protein AGOR_G00020940 [Albula goreensis]